MKTPKETLMEDLIKRIESKINATPTGDLRNLLTDINTCIRANQSKWISVEEEQDSLAMAYAESNAVNKIDNDDFTTVEEAKFYYRGFMACHKWIIKKIL